MQVSVKSHQVHIMHTGDCTELFELLVIRSVKFIANIASPLAGKPKQGIETGEGMARYTAGLDIVRTGASRQAGRAVRQGQA